jgi:hypothetical protein
MQKIRDALGVIAVAAPARYRLCRATNDTWCVRRAGSRNGTSFASREEALQWIRLAVIRCKAYSLLLEVEHGGWHRETYNWPPSCAKDLPG